MACADKFSLKIAAGSPSTIQIIQMIDSREITR
jgi:hypothetical protein